MIGDKPSTARVVVLTALAMSAFAANSLLCRVALKSTAIDPATFTALRIVSGAATLAAIAAARGRPGWTAGSAASALALFAYAATFSFAYVTLPAGTGALLLFGAVQATMLVAGIRAGERIVALQAGGLVLAMGGLVVLVLPGVSAPPPAGTALMLLAGLAWGIYSLRGRGVADPAASTTGNFLRAAPLALALFAAASPWLRFDLRGALYAVLSGVVASGLGYTLWYAALRGLTATRAAIVQLSAPVLAAVGGVTLLGERATLRLAFASAAVLGGIAIVTTQRARATSRSSRSA